ncbi:DUF3667 domain-containing protein [Phenylobacterium sp.]|jgi:hypothetical protein|uniref:DUF3667 domain-containing protein n=1 Tax=Phenylobacterium sp. TaxID=1871053 RepID=UPI002601196C|nr:DUF3667 domain-containing protein [Phenylobacterium sp.]MCA6287470.1 DUF3667 domain-containing protein [Phenylobacterium sp.]MCA6289944.1 DUF3667 domain-containing protein [Phenylobacterium sp.]MCA6309283.1 DUF3667 domain-containing protein [Phenylobacterium sp.]MCA6322937.1 DUF3667 domain-containing protein [Phenylobacterium sp.]MCA6336844.1 DUF3667 domain-containing protein [Phenylobacterium sp.]
MSGVELEVASADAVADLAAAGGPRPGGSACANCGAALTGRFCHECGQNSDLRKRSILHLAWEAGESLFHLDGRLARTLSLLFLRPGKLARDQIDGRLARYTPPFRTFLVALLLYIFAAEAAIHRLQRDEGVRTPTPPAATASPQPASKAAAGPGDTSGSEVGTRDAFNAVVSSGELDLGIPGLSKVWEDRLRAGLQTAVENPGYFLVVMFGWAHRLAFLLLPISVLILTVLYIGRRGVFVYDHILVASNLLSFTLLTNAVGLVLPEGFAVAWFLLLAAWTPLNMYQTLRGAYGSSRLGAALRTLILWPGGVLSFAVLLVGLLAFSVLQL